MAKALSICASSYDGQKFCAKHTLQAGTETLKVLVRFCTLLLGMRRSILPAKFLE